MLQKLDKGHSVALVLLDLSAAFDTVDHGVLLQRLRGTMGVTGRALEWIASFLKDRTQIIRWNSSFSESCAVQWGVPQGSSLSPLLFNIYLQPLADLLASIGPRCQLFADDTQLLFDLHPGAAQSERIVPTLLAIQDWMANNNLKLNGDKTELLVVPGTRGGPLPPIPWPSSWGSAPRPSERLRNLGIRLEAMMDGDAQASSASQTANHQLNQLAVLLPLLDIPQRIKLTRALVGSRLSYGLQVTLGSSIKTLNRLQKVQNRAVRMIFGLPWGSHVSVWRRQLSWLTIKDQQKIKICSWIWKILHQQGPSYMQDWITNCPFSTVPRKQHLKKIKPMKIARSTRGGRSMAHGGVNIWNNLPVHIRLLENWSVFRRALTEHFLLLDRMNGSNDPEGVEGSSSPNRPSRTATVHPRLAIGRSRPFQFRMQDRRQGLPQFVGIKAIHHASGVNVNASTGVRTWGLSD